MNDKYNSIRRDRDGRIIYFDYPVQVQWMDMDWDPDESEGQTEEDRPIMAGIGLHEYIICMCCGGMVRLDELYESAAECKYTGEVVKPFDDWIDVSEIFC